MRYLCGLAAVCFLMIGLGTFALGEKNMEKQGIGKTSSIPRFASLGKEEQMKVLQQLSRERIDVMGSLISQLEESNPKEANFAIAYLLGFYRMEQSVPHLSKYIALKIEKIERVKALPLYGEYPVVEALIRIGNPAIRQMIKNIESSDDEKVRKLSARVIRYVDGPEIAKFRLEKTIEKQSDPTKKSRLKAALESMAK